MKLRWDHPLWRRLAPPLAKTLAQAYLRTCIADLSIGTEVKNLALSGRPLIYTVWHCHLLYPLYYFRRYYPQLPPTVVMASPSRDGEFIGEVARGLGFTVCFGSRRKGGVQALQQMADYFRRGYNCGLIADGSRGPARVAQKGPLYLARETQAPIIPLAVAGSRKITFNTWDRFELPLPFSRLVVMVGEPLYVQPTDRGRLLEDRRLDLETRLNLLFDQSQQYFSL
ncbi:MAG: lysophospholipid acyltransferase family protein [Deltaproteobacteria bacterium]|nr:lysophospholipid acyltransferase family protein [Deltaproteobacteria bacterium]